MHKAVAKIHQLSWKQAFPGLKGVDIMAHAHDIEPFLVFTEFHMDQPVFGPHPHAGISVMTYMLPDSAQGFINRDSQGDFSYIEPGGMHIMQAGSGMLHDEFPRTPGTDAHGFQIWINHHRDQRMAEPKSMHAAATDIPEVIAPHYRVRVVHGELEGTQAPHAMVTPVQLWHIFLQPHQTMVLPAQPMTFLYGLKGSGSTGGQLLGPQSLVLFSTEGQTIELTAHHEGLECMLAAGTPHNQPLVYGGPFVMTTREEMAATQHRYAAGAMGHLDPYHP